MFSLIAIISILEYRTLFKNFSLEEFERSSNKYTVGKLQEKLWKMGKEVCGGGLDYACLFTQHARFDRSKLQAQQHKDYPLSPPGAKSWHGGSNHASDASHMIQMTSDQQLLIWDGGSITQDTRQ